MHIAIVTRTTGTPSDKLKITSNVALDLLVWFSTPPLEDTGKKRVHGYIRIVYGYIRIVRGYIRIVYDI